MAEVQKARLPESERSVWLVVGDDFLPIEPIRRFLDYLDDLERSPTPCARTPTTSSNFGITFRRTTWIGVRSGSVSWLGSSPGSVAEAVGWFLSRNNKLADQSRQ